MVVSHHGVMVGMHKVTTTAQLMLQITPPLSALPVLPPLLYLSHHLNPITSFTSALTFSQYTTET